MIIVRLDLVKRVGEYNLEFDVEQHPNYINCYKCIIFVNGRARGDIIVNKDDVDDVRLIFEDGKYVNLCKKDLVDGYENAPDPCCVTKW